MQKYDVAAYVWPAYTGDESRTRTFWAEGIGEWQTVKNSAPKMGGYHWNRRPLWGYQNEADRYVMEMQIEAAVDHGVNVFIYDWYWFDNRPFLEGCLNDGFLKAKNRDKMRFYLMWANHDVNNTWDIRNSGRDDNVIWGGAVDRGQFETICERIIEKYFSQPNYYRIDGKPVFMIYDLQNLIKGLGGVEQTREAFEWFRERSGGVQLQLTMWGEQSFNLSGVDGGAVATTSEVAEILGFQSMSHYQFCHFTNIDRDYEEIIPDVLNEWARIDGSYSIPFFPHVSVGWDNNPRFLDFRGGIVKNNTPEMIEKMLVHAREYADKHPEQPPLITINSWNEWTETSYLQPDDLFGYGYLEAVKRTFLS